MPGNFAKMLVTMLKNVSVNEPTSKQICQKSLMDHTAKETSKKTRPKNTEEVYFVSLPDMSVKMQGFYASCTANSTTSFIWSFPFCGQVIFKNSQNLFYRCSLNFEIPISTFDAKTLEACLLLLSTICFLLQVYASLKWFS